MHVPQFIRFIRFIRFAMPPVKDDGRGPAIERPPILCLVW
ncbi:hypothetical protein AKJ09_01180 [Labilithrix luteola]|uniref:Uncharacterized protein n=1 Tax=Labilithrix luteola TaxID=1391654 RepID=A0A0K1PM87_9BACT|nr:hypothetical protein AKJ09_01180 [Labilithrix luteola]